MKGNDDQCLGFICYPPRIGPEQEQNGIGIRSLIITLEHKSENT